MLQHQYKFHFCLFFYRENNLAIYMKYGVASQSRQITLTSEAIFITSLTTPYGYYKDGFVLSDFHHFFELFF